VRNLVVCCDGTWQDIVDRSNVRRLYETLDASVVPRYVKGVGTGNVLDKLRGGVTGSGLTATLLEGYRFLAEEYQPGDHISLFGFSRGAYTARSLAGMIGGVGIVDRAGLDKRRLDATVREAYKQYRVLREERKSAAGNAAGLASSSVTAPARTGELPLAYDPRSPDIPLVFLGVWDTVGALGIPSYVGVPDLLGSRQRYEFMDVILDSRIAHARHAVSLDEMRGPFRPTLWAESAAGANQDIKQVWFPGDHSDVGGGHDDDARLSDGALRWMIDEAEAAVGLPFDTAKRAAIVPDAVKGTLHGMERGAWGAVMEVAFQPCPRATPLVDDTWPLPDRVAGSAYERQKGSRGLPPEKQYRPSRTLEPGETASVVVDAKNGWNATGLYLEESGTYRFTAAGEWRTPFGRCGPRGLARWPVVGDAFGKVVDLVELGLRGLLRNPQAELAGARREANEPLMALIGVVANEVTDAEGKIVERGEKFVIGDRLDAVIERSGYLWAYANDAWGAYGNNDGQVTLTVNRQN
jgi:uncharacterized protein (DUF2235 family)